MCCLDPVKGLILLGQMGILFLDCSNFKNQEWCFSTAASGVGPVCVFGGDAGWGQSAQLK